jgi:ubiquinol-cytochrome c reductase cytochrome b subunit
LPWDQKAYWATVVGTHIAGTAPLIGDHLWSILQGGEDVGVRTLGRFYTAHVLILPAILYGFILIHLSIVIYQGIAPTPSRGLNVISKEEYAKLYDASKEKGETFLEHLLRDGIVSFILLLLLVCAAIAWRVPMEEVADPTDTQYVPRPEWYFYFLFELLWLFWGKWVPMATFYIPLVGIILLFLLPFYDRTPGRSPLRRPLASGLATATVTAMAFLTYQGATAPLPPAATIAREVKALSPELARGMEVYEGQGCSACHVVKGRGTAAGPDLSRVGTSRDKEWLKQFLKNPSAVKPGSPMPPYPQLPEEQMEALVGYLASLK